MEYLINTPAAAFTNSILNAVLPKTDPARTITAGTILYLGVTRAIYPMLVWTYQTIRSKIRERARATQRAQQKKDVVYLYMFPKKPNEIKNNNNAKTKKKSGSSSKSKKSGEETLAEDVTTTQSSTNNNTNTLTEEEKEAVVEEQSPSPSAATSSSKPSSSSSDPTVINKMNKMFSLSCPCMSVELFLRINKIPFEEVIVIDADEVSPTGRLPMIEYNGEVITDSWYIMDFLEKKFDTVAVSAEKNKKKPGEKEQDHQNEDGDQEETKDQEATTTADLDDEATALKKRRKANFAVVEESKTIVSVQRIVESLRLCYGRAVLVDNVDAMIKIVSSEFQYPKAIVSWIFKSHRAETITMLNQHGLGDLNDEQFQKTFLDDVKTLTSYITANPLKTQEHPNDVLKSKFILGEKSPSKLDCLVAPYFNVLRFYESEKKIAENCPAIAFVLESPVITDYLKKFDKALNAAACA